MAKDKARDVQGTQKESLETNPNEKRNSSRDVLDPLASSTSQSTSSLDLIQGALDMLDYRTTIDRSTRALLEADPTSEPSIDIAQILNLRSIANEKVGQFSLAIEDAEKAVGMDATNPTYHLRLALAHEAASLHSIARARENFLNLQSSQSHLLSIEELQSAESRVIQNQSLIKKSPFRRISPEQFTTAMSFCEAPTLGRALGVSKAWRNSILSSQSLFKAFIMRGKCQDVCEGLKLFNQQTNNGILQIVLVLMDEFTVQLWREGIEPSLHRLQDVRLHVSKGGNWAQFFLELLQNAPQLKVLNSIRVKGGTGSRGERFEFPRFSQEMKLEEFTWHKSVIDFDYDSLDDSISFLKNLKYLEISSDDATWTVLIKFLINCPNLKTVSFPRINHRTSYSSLIQIPNTQLPCLEYLTIASLPVLAGPKCFFSTLHPSCLRSLEITEVFCSQLDPLVSISSLRMLVIYQLFPEDLERAAKSDLLGEIEAADLIKILSRATSLRVLGLRLRPNSASYKFWETLITSMTPLSSFNVRKGLDDQSLIMPNLQALELGNESLGSPLARPNEQTLDSEISAGIISLVAARRAASQGLSKASIRLCANGFVEDVEDQVRNPDSFYCKYSEIINLSFRLQIESSRKSVNWLKKNISETDLSGFWWEEAVDESGNQKKSSVDELYESLSRTAGNSIVFWCVNEVWQNSLKKHGSQGGLEEKTEHQRWNSSTERWR